MKCESTDLEIETIVNRIKNEDMDLQPDFQRGEIWTLQKKQKLIDSIGDCETGLVFDVQKRQTPDFVGDKQEK